jgi:hypothetical protein
MNKTLLLVVLVICGASCFIFSAIVGSGWLALGELIFLLAVNGVYEDE